jgi:hypothetical protein
MTAATTTALPLLASDPQSQVKSHINAFNLTPMPKDRHITIMTPRQATSTHTLHPTPKIAMAFVADDLPWPSVSKRSARPEE